MATNSRDIFDDLTYKTPSSAKKKGRIAAKSALSGALGTYGDIFDLLRLQAKEQLPGEKIQRQREFETLEKLEKGGKPSFADIESLTEEEILPRYSRLPSSSQLEEALGPEQPESFVERLLQRGGRSLGAGAALGAGPGTLLSMLGGSAAGQVTKELGAPEPVADIVDLLTSLTVGKPIEKLVPSSKQADLVKTLRDKGFTDKEITPLIQSAKKMKFFGKGATKSEKVGERLKASKERIGSIYSSVREEGKQLKGLSGPSYDKFTDSVEKILEDIRPGYRRLIRDELSDLSSSEHKISDFIDFYQDINQKVKGVEGGKAILNKLKPALLEGIKDISPTAAEDFKLANTLYSKLSKTARSLKPSQWEDMYELGKLTGIGAGIASGNIGMLGKIAGLSGARLLARELLINPKLQNFSSKIALQVKKNNPAAVRKLTEQTLKYLEKEKPDIFSQLKIEEE